MELHPDTSGPFAVARVASELTASDCEAFLESVSDVAFGPNSRLAVDLSGLQSLDSQGLSALIHLVTRARLNHGRVVLVSPQPFVRGLFNVTRLDTWFDLCDSLQEASGALRCA